ncbi:MAG: HEAT repeat domain-containing protein, partial [Thermodesulfobacteriota bacterium]
TRDLSAVTEGNPLFIVAVLRKMVDDGKIYHKNDRWRVARLERNYFPRSLEEIIQQKKALLDNESRSFIDGASAFGESMSLSLLAGFSKERSAKIYDYINEAQAKGLVRSEFSETDENIRFSGKQVRNVIYEDIPEEIKKDIQARIGYYKEDLYNRDLLPSTAILTHHFTQSSDSDKARTYQQFQADYANRLFSPEEAETYADSETRPGEGIARAALSPDAMAHVPALLRALVVALRNFRLYPARSRSVEKAVNQLFVIIEKIHATDERISVISDKNALLVNQQEIDTSAYPSIAASLIEAWDRLELHHLTLIRGIRKEEVSELVHKLSHTSGKSITPGFWQAFRRTHSLPHVDIGQIQYERRSAPPAAEQGPRPDSAGPGEEGDFPPLETAAFDFSDAAFHAVEQIIANLLGAVNKFRLYPSDGPVARDAVRQLHAALQSFFARHEAINLARVESSLLVNGVKVDASGFETLAGSLFKFFSESGIESLSFLSGTRPDELTRFLSTVCASPAGEAGEGPDRTALPEASQIPHIRINEGLYGIQEKAAGQNRQARTEPEITEPGTPSSMEKPDPRDLPARLRDLFLTGNLETVRNLLADLQKAYTNGDEPAKHSVIEQFDALLTPGDWKPNAEFIQLVITPVMELLQIETRPALINEAARLGYKAVQEFIGFGEYRLATWVMAQIRSHPEGGRIQAIEMPAPVLEDLVQGLDAADKNSQQSAFQLLSSMGETVRPHLINMIKRENSLRARRLAAELLRHQGREGAAALKRSLMSEHIPENRARILDVIDVVTTNIQLELYYALANFKSEVRQAAGRLAERLNSPAVVDMLIQVAQGEDPGAAVTAVGLLGRLNALSASDTMIRLLEESEDEELLVAACRAMGQIGDASFVIPLQNILRSRRSLLFRKARSSQVRVAAAYAIAQINDPRCPRILKALLNDADPRLRETARNLTG